MKSIINKISQGLVLMPLLVLGLSLVPSPAFASDGSGHGRGGGSGACDTTTLSIDSGAECANSESTPDTLFGGADSIFQKVTNILLFLVGAISVIMLIIGGIRYVISGGDQAQVTSAKNTILYAIVGIIVAFLAFAAVRFVTSSIGGA